MQAGEIPSGADHEDLPPGLGEIPGLHQSIEGAIPPAVEPPENGVVKIAPEDDQKPLLGGGSGETRPVHKFTVGRDGAEQSEVSSPREIHGQGDTGEEDGRGGGSDSEDAFRGAEASHDLNAAREQVGLIGVELGLVADEDKPKVAELSDEVAALNRLLDLIGQLMADGQPVPAGLAVSVTLRVEMSREAAKDAKQHADGELRGTLKRVLKNLRGAGQELLSMNLHLFPVKEWSLGGEVSAVFLKGSISVTFGK